ncbi:hypothetical protein PkP19E3_23315 [Pseudomonas koreensis]|nr:hypothetical protein PkP19E3_23315 [Pseudomonas koreensis]
MSVNGEFGQTDGVGFRREVLRKIQFVHRAHLFPAVLSRFVDVPLTLVRANQELWGSWMERGGFAAIGDESPRHGRVVFSRHKKTAYLSVSRF